MTTSAPSHKAPPGWIEPQSSEDNEIDAKQLDIGIAGINLSNFTGNRPPTLSGSSVSTNPDESHSRQHSFGSYNGVPDIHRGTPPSPETPIHRGQSMPSFNGQGRPPGLGGPFPSPIGKSGSATNTLASSAPLTLTPGSSVDGTVDYFSEGRHASPLRSTNQSFTEHVSETGNNLRRGGSPWSDHTPAPSTSPFSQMKEYQSAYYGNEELDLDHDDGLRGLGALRERAYSSPGPLMTAGGNGFGSGQFSSSPPVRTDSSGFHLPGSPLHMDVGAFRDEGNWNFPADPRRGRTPSKDGLGKAVSRPPRAGGVATPHSIFIEGNLNLLSSQGDRVHEYHEGIGRGRSLSTGTMSARDLLQIHQEGDMRINANEIHRMQSHLDHSHEQKFGSLPNLNTHHVQYPRMPRSAPQQQFGGMQQPLGHVRSYSQPGPEPMINRGSHDLHGATRGSDFALEYSPQQCDPQFLDEGESLHSGQVRGGGGRYVQHIPPPSLARSVSAGNTLPHMQGTHQQPRRTTMAHSTMPHPSLSSGAFDEVQQRRSSFQGSSSQYHCHDGPPHHSLQRRDAMDFIDSRGSGQPRAERPIMATREEMAIYEVYAGDRFSSASSSGSGTRERQPQNVHNRHHSDGGGVLSSAAMSEGNRSMSGDMAPGLRLDTRSFPSQFSQLGQLTFEDDLAHPLAGEYIDDPGDDMGLSIGGRSEYYGLSPHEVSGVYGPSDGTPSHQSRHSFSSASQLEPLPTAGHSRAYSEAHHSSVLPSAPGPRVVYSIKFKRSQRSFVAGPRLNRDLDIGCYVKVEADRGEDLGIVVGKMPAEKFNSSAGRAAFRPGGSPSNADSGGIGPAPTCASDLKRVIRLATHDEVNLLTVKREEEDELLSICRTKVRQRALPMKVVDAEYQFDRHKLTFFFEAEGRVDFRELVRDLFSIYKTRIWMQQIDKNGSMGSASSAYLTGIGVNSEFSGSGAENSHVIEKTESY